jgi:hypothetical protein
MAVIAAVLAVVVATILIQATAVRPGIARHNGQHKQNQADQFHWQSPHDYQRKTYARPRYDRCAAVG